MVKFRRAEIPAHVTARHTIIPHTLPIGAIDRLIKARQAEVGATTTVWTLTSRQSSGNWALASKKLADKTLRSVKPTQRQLKMALQILADNTMLAVALRIKTEFKATKALALVNGAINFCEANRLGQINYFEPLIKEARRFLIGINAKGPAAAVNIPRIVLRFIEAVNSMKLLAILGEEKYAKFQGLFEQAQKEAARANRAGKGAKQFKPSVTNWHN